METWCCRNFMFVFWVDLMNPLLFLVFPFRMASPDTECPAWLQGCDPSQETNAHPQTEAHGGHKIHSSSSAFSSGRLPFPNQKCSGGNQHLSAYTRLYLCYPHKELLFPQHHVLLIWVSRQCSHSTVPQYSTSKNICNTTASALFHLLPFKKTRSLRANTDAGL